MSRHQDALLRQWLMLRHVPRYPRKVTVQDLRRVLADEGFDITERSLQRDLNELSGAFAIVCDDREKPYGWSWQKDAPSFDLPGITPAQALTLAMAEQHLQNLLPKPMLAELRPYFLAARRRLDAEPAPRRNRCWLDKVRTVFVNLNVNEEYWPAIEDGLAEKLVHGKETGPTKLTMDIDRQRELFSRYPKIFPKSIWMAGSDSASRGIECGNGWHTLIERLCASLQQSIDILGEPQVAAVQVRECLGGLRFYVRPCTQRQRGMIELAQAMSKRTCEACGKPGRGRSKEGNYTYTLCDEHRETNP